MQSDTLSAQVSVSGQMTVDDVPGLHEQGVEIVICNRPDDEEPGQTPYADIQQAVEQAGMQFANIPFSGGGMTQADCEQFAALMATGKRIHAYCRTGNRCTVIWAASKDMLVQ